MGRQSAGLISQTAPSSPGRPADVIEEIHKLRLAAHQKQETDKAAVKQIKIQISRKEKDDILNKYFSAKRQLSNITERYDQRA